MRNFLKDIGVFSVFTQLMRFVAVAALFYMLIRDSAKIGTGEFTLADIYVFGAVIASLIYLIRMRIFRD